MLLPPTVGYVLDGTWFSMSHELKISFGNSIVQENIFKFLLNSYLTTFTRPLATLLHEFYQFLRLAKPLFNSIKQNKTHERP